MARTHSDAHVLPLSARLQAVDQFCRGRLAGRSMAKHHCCTSSRCHWPADWHWFLPSRSAVVRGRWAVGHDQGCSQGSRSQRRLVGIHHSQPAGQPATTERTPIPASAATTTSVSTATAVHHHARLWVPHREKLRGQRKRAMPWRRHDWRCRHARRMCVCVSHAGLFPGRARARAVLLCHGSDS